MDDKKNNSTADSYKKGVTPDSLKTTNNGNTYNGNGITSLNEGVKPVCYSIDSEKDNK